MRTYTIGQMITLKSTTNFQVQSCTEVQECDATEVLSGLKCMEKIKNPALK